MAPAVKVHLRRLLHLQPGCQLIASSFDNLFRKCKVNLVVKEKVWECEMHGLLLSLSWPGSSSRVHTGYAYRTQTYRRLSSSFERRQEQATRKQPLTHNPPIYSSKRHGGPYSTIYFLKLISSLRKKNHDRKVTAAVCPWKENTYSGPKIASSYTQKRKYWKSVERVQKISWYFLSWGKIQRCS